MDIADYIKTAKRVPGHGPVPSPVCIVGEAAGINEEIYGRPFVGEAGNELNRMLKETGFDPASIYKTNVFKIRPPDTEKSRNDISTFFARKSEPDADLATFPGMRDGSTIKYLRRDLVPMVGGLIPELVDVGAQLVIALGNTALWGLLGRTKISAFVGTVHPPTAERPFTVLPTYHPAAILRQYSFRSTAIANLIKAGSVARELAERIPGQAPVGSKSPAAKNPSPFKIKINPTLAEVEAFAEIASKAPEIAFDVETKHGQIRTIAFSIEPNSAFVIPFWEPPRPPYWPTFDGELRAWKAVKRILESPGDKIGQNILYDIQYCWRVHGIRVRGTIHDTMAAAHAMEPELPRTLGYLAATFLNIPEWKTMRIKSEKDEE